ncbi:MAG: efflux RND transporter permease subunit, partial [Acidobacteria bacterium]|nr:efflux RND transporter permease subunit [Acidobacteriota bacterium]
MASFFVNRPIVAMVISILMVLLGAVAMMGLPISQYPEITPPEILVEATYTGASAVDVEQSVATPVEQQVNGVENMIYMKSTNAADGKMQLRVSFDVGTDLDIANVLTQNRVTQANPSLPEEVKRLGVSVKKSLAFPLLLVTLTSPKGSYDSGFLSNYASINIIDAIARTRGVGLVNQFGGSDYAMRIWIRPDRLAQLGLTIPDIQNAIQQQSVIAAAGQIGGPPAPKGTDFTYTVKTAGRLQTPEEFGEVVLRSNPDGSQVRLKDVARIELGAQTYSMIGRLNGKPAAVLAIYQIPGSNALEVAGTIRKTMEELSQRFPEDLEYAISLDTTLSVTEGINEIVHTLFEAVVLVLLVVFVFLQNWRATLIPLLTVPVSLVATFIVFPMLGFSINTLSLLGLVLAIGIVVDDAIVVVEAVMHHVEQGMSPKDATLQAMKEVSGPVVAIALVLSAVFVPVAFVSGITGRLYQQFAITIAISVLFSALNALTLSPALSAKLIKTKGESKSFLDPFYRGFNKVFDAITNGYIAVTRRLVTNLPLALGLVAALIVGTVFLARAIPGGFVPEEDQGYFLINVQLPEAASQQRTDAICREAERILGETGGIESYTTVVGYSLLSSSSSSDNAFFFVSLKEWGERSKEEHVFQLIRKLNGRFAREIPGALVYAFGPPAIPGLGTGSGFSIMVQDQAGGTPDYLEDQVQKFIAEARKRPEIGNAFTTFSARVPQLFADIDREKVLKLGVQLKDVNTTLGASLGGSYINDFNRFGRLYKVYAQAEPEYRAKADTLGQYFVRNAQGDMVPLSTLVQFEPLSGPSYTNRFNLFRAAEVTGTPAPGYSSSQAIEALKSVAKESLPTGMGYAWNAMSFQEVAAAGTAAVVFVFALVVVFLILAAQYESWSLPFSVLLGTPFAAFGAFFGLWAA